MTIVRQLLTNEAYGIPRGRPRRIAPVALAMIHITGNRNTAANPDARAACQGERNYANRADSNGPSAHLYIARDGWGIEAVDADRYAAWSNGDVNAPNTANPGIRRVLAMRAKGYNANEGYWEEYEAVGFGIEWPITAAQKDTIARRIATRSSSSGLPIDRETVHGHWEINGVDRRNCPVSYARREAFLADVIGRARAFATTKEDIVKVYSVPGSTSAVWPAGTPIHPGPTEAASGKTGAERRYLLVGQDKPTSPARYLVDGAGGDPSGAMAWLPTAGMKSKRDETFNAGVAAAATAAAAAKR